MCMDCMQICVQHCQVPFTYIDVVSHLFYACSLCSLRLETEKHLLSIAESFEKTEVKV